MFKDGVFIGKHPHFPGPAVGSAVEPPAQHQPGAEARNMYESFGLHMGHALKAVLYAYDPQLIILGGAIRKAYPYFKEAMYAEMADFAYPKSLDALELKISVLEHAAVLGAAALPLDEQLVNNNSNL